MPSLKSIELGDNACMGNENDERKEIDDKPYNFKNRLAMKGTQIYIDKS